MANQDFDINIRVNANTAQVDAIRNSFEKLGAQVKVTNAEMAAGGGVGGFGSAVGIGTIASLVTGAIRQWEAFNAEQDKVVDGMIKAQEKSRELGLAVADMLDAMKSAERIDTEPLQVSFDRLKQKVSELKTEMKLAFEAGQYEDVKKIAAALGVVESQLDRVTTSIDKQKAATDRLAAAKEKALEKELSAQRQFEAAALGSANINVQRALQNEEAARRTGDQGFKKSAEAYERGLGPDQRAELEQLRKVRDQGDAASSQPVGRRAGVGESQAIVDQLEKNRIDFQKMIDAQQKLADQWR